MVSTLLVTGGHGFLGRRVVREAERNGWEVLAPTSSELDVRDATALDELFAANRLRAVAHLAYRRTERDTIVDGSAQVARRASSFGARLVHLSTDVVFGGRPEPYLEQALPDPVEGYGAAKAEAELVVARVCPTAVLVRTSLLLGDPGDPGQPERDVFGALRDRSGFRFFTDEVRSPLFADDLAVAVVRLAGELDGVAGALHVAGPEALTRYQLAERIARSTDLDPAALVPTSLTEAGLAGRRPGRVVLDSSRAGSLGLTARAVPDGPFRSR